MMNRQKSDSKHQIKIGALLSYVIIGFNIVTGLVYTPWMVSKVGQSSYGIYTLASSLIAFFTLDFGIGDAIAKFLSQFNAEGEKQKENDFLGVSVKIYGMIDMIIFAAFALAFVFADRLYTQLTPSELSQFRLIFLLAAFYSVISFPFMPLNGILVAHERFIFYRFTEFVNKVIVVVSMIVALLLGEGIFALVVVNAVAGLIVILLKTAYIRKNHLVRPNFKARDKMTVKQIFSFSLWSCLFVIAQRFIYNVEPTLLGHFSSSGEIAVFSVASTIEGYTATLTGALGSLFLPRVSRIYVGGNSEKELQKLTERVGRIQLMIVGILLMGLYFMGREFMVLWMGESYVNSYYTLLGMIVSYLFTIPLCIPDTALVATDHMNLKAICGVVCAVCNVIISVVAIPYLGAVGAGLGIAFGNILGGVILKVIIYKRTLKIRLWTVAWDCYLKYLPVAAVTAFFMFVLQRYLPAANLFLFLIKVAAVIIVYLVLLWLIFMDKSEKNLAIGLFKKN